MPATGTGAEAQRVKVGVWGTGNMGRAAIRAVLGHPDLELAALVTSAESKRDRDAGTFVGLPDTGVRATTDASVLAGAGCRAVAYMASGDLRPEEAADDIETCLRDGITVVTPALYALYDPRGAPAELRERMEAACAKGHSSLFVSGVDPGWANDWLALAATGLSSGITEVRCQEIFDYSTYDQEFSVRELVGMGQPISGGLPPMVAPGVPTMVWGGQVRLIARALGAEVLDIAEKVERRPLHVDVTTALGRFAAGSQGALRFEVVGECDGGLRIVVEHVTRIHPAIAPDWPEPASGAGSHRVVVEGDPRLEITVEAETEGANRAAGGNATAALRLVGAIPWLLANGPGTFDGATVPLMPGRGRVGSS